MSIHLDAASAGAREAARQDNGQFGTQPLDEVTVELDAGHAPDSPIASALRDAGLDGPTEQRPNGDLTYTDESTGYRYDIQADGSTFQVRAEDVDSFGYVMSFGNTSPDPARIAAELGRVMDAACQVRSFNYVADKWAATDAGDRGHGWTEPQLDVETGQLSGNGWTISGFTTAGDYAPIEMELTLTERDPDDAVTFRYCRDQDGSTYVTRGEEYRQPLANWEERALDSHMAGLMRRGGFVPSVRDLFDAARIKNAASQPRQR